VRALGSGVRDRLQSLLPRVGPHTVPAAGDDADRALVPDGGLLRAYRRLADVPEVPARAFLALARYRAPTDAGCPTLLVAGSYDNLAPADAVAAAAADRPETTVLRVPAAHLDLLDDEETREHALVFLDGVFG
jgi:pimeloyl-ACP methyl ester carboxylesterase